jgi:ribosome-binding protein aMBF1 (putative translation factor)
VTTQPTPDGAEVATPALEPSDIDGTLARNIRSEREYLGLSQEDVASVLGVPRPAISSIENGRRMVNSG